MDNTERLISHAQADNELHLASLDAAVSGALSQVLDAHEALLNELDSLVIGAVNAVFQKNNRLLDRMDANVAGAVMNSLQETNLQMSHLMGDDPQSARPSLPASPSLPYGLLLPDATGAERCLTCPTDSDVVTPGYVWYLRCCCCSFGVPCCVVAVPEGEQPPYIQGCVYVGPHPTPRTACLDKSAGAIVTDTLCKAGLAPNASLGQGVGDNAVACGVGDGTGNGVGLQARYVRWGICDSRTGELQDYGCFPANSNPPKPPQVLDPPKVWVWLLFDDEEKCKAYSWTPGKNYCQSDSTGGNGLGGDSGGDSGNDGGICPPGVNCGSGASGGSGNGGSQDGSSGSGGSGGGSSDGAGSGGSGSFGTIGGGSGGATSGGSGSGNSGNGLGVVGSGGTGLGTGGIGAGASGDITLSGGADECFRRLAAFAGKGGSLGPLSGNDFAQGVVNLANAMAFMSPFHCEDIWQPAQMGKRSFLYVRQAPLTPCGEWSKESYATPEGLRWILSQFAACKGGGLDAYPMDMTAEAAWEMAQPGGNLSQLIKKAANLFTDTTKDTDIR